MIQLQSKRDHYHRVVDSVRSLNQLFIHSFSSNDLWERDRQVHRILDAHHTHQPFTTAPTLMAHRPAPAQDTAEAVHTRSWMAGEQQRPRGDETKEDEERKGTEAESKGIGVRKDPTAAHTKGLPKVVFVGYRDGRKSKIKKPNFCMKREEKDEREGRGGTSTSSNKLRRFHSK